MALENENTQDHQDICASGFIGAALACLSPLAIGSIYLLFLPILSVGFLLYAFVRIALNRRPMRGARVACWGFYFALICLAASIANPLAYNHFLKKSGARFAAQWCELATEGRMMEALQLEKPSLQRARGAGIVKRYTQDKDDSQNYQAFCDSTPVKTILAEFIHADYRFVRCESVTKMKRARSYRMVFEFSKGEGVMKKSRYFAVQIMSSYIKASKRYEWRFQRVELIPAD
ncbi:MAG: hypothetical protein Q4D38_00965 [Planctomycetia bacterium]|nr:hypothetical protein [Planctomycetia bacterium]